jgi:hypothetical protein
MFRQRSPDEAKRNPGFLDALTKIHRLDDSLYPDRTAIAPSERAYPGFRGVYHRARIRATRWLHPG